MTKTKTYVLASLLLVAALACMPLLLPPNVVGAMSSMLIAALFALAFSLLVGQAGMLSFGHAAYFAVGCFATIHAMQAVEAGSISLPTPLLPLVGGVAALVVGTVAGFFATLRSGVYFSMVTLAIAELFHALAPSLQGLFGGESGISSIRQPWAGISFGNEGQVYYLVLAWVTVCALLLYLYTHTSFGRLTVALRENERRIAFLGYNVHGTKMLVFSVSSTFAGIAGGLLAVSNESANYLLFSMSYSANIVLFSYIGGVGTFIGPAIGAATMTLFGHAVSDVTRQWLLYQGLIFIAVMMYAPAGVVGFAQTQGRQMLRGEGASLPRRGVMLLPMLVISAATVFMCEMAGTIFSRDYQAQLARTRVWEPVAKFGRSWSPDSVLTWLLPAACLVAAGYVLYRIARPQPMRVVIANLKGAHA